MPSPLLFPPLTFQHKKAYFRGKWHGCHLSESWREHICGEPKISLFVRLRTLVASSHSWLLLLAVEKKTGLKGFKTKTITRTPRGTMERSVLFAFKK
ncbi:MAG: hypothetical protein ACI8UG_002031 [Gammaproteobacteria bacterium]|jgi:hypothetical protein